MKKRTILSVAVALFLLGGCANDVNQNNPDSFVEVMGSAENEVDPDIFYLGITLSESKTANITAMEKKMLDILTTLGIDTKTDLSVTGASGDNWNWWRKTRTVVQTKNYQLKAANLETLNTVCDLLDKMGYVNYYLSRVDYSKVEELKQQTEQEAVKKARAKAENLLGGAGKSVGELIYIQEQGIGNNNMYQRQIYAEYSKMDSGDPAVSFQKMKITHTVIARFSIK